MTLTPRYPVYVPSKGRFENPLTARFLERDGVDFRVVVEREQEEEYAAAVGRDRLLVLPFSNQGLFQARNWIKEHATQAGYERHWQLDDNIMEIRRWYRGERIPCASGPALRAVEDFSDRYENVAISGLNYQMFGIRKPGARLPNPYVTNCHVYSCTLVNNAIPHRWRLLYNDDTDLCLQVLSDGWCTVLVNVFLANKLRTMVAKGGNTDDLYQGDGRLRMARDLERMWPGVVTVYRRFGRAQHLVKNNWMDFRTPLKLRAGVDPDPPPSEYGLELRAVRDVSAPGLRRLLDDS